MLFMRCPSHHDVVHYVWNSLQQFSITLWKIPGAEEISYGRLVRIMKKILLGFNHYIFLGFIVKR